MSDHEKRDIDYREFAKYFRSTLRDNELTVSDVAQGIGLSVNTTKRLLMGDVNPNSKSMRTLIDYLNVPEEEFQQLFVKRSSSKGTSVFISYSHKDKDYLDRLLVHLKPLEKEGIIDSWADTRLLAGDRWRSEINTALENARVAILLVSADFLASDFIIDNELPPLLLSAEKEGALIIPVILKPCRFSRDKELSNFQAINSPEEPLSFMDENERENIYDAVALRIENALGK